MIKFFLVYLPNNYFDKTLTKMDFKIEEPVSLTNSQIEEIENLMHVLSPRCHTSQQQLEKILLSPHSHLFVLFHDSKIIGCCTAGVYFSPTGTKASIEDVVVLPEYQGQQLGRKLMEHAICFLRPLAPIQVMLTSKPARIAANALYKSMGFVPKETNVYVMNL